MGYRGCTLQEAAHLDGLGDFLDQYTREGKLQHDLEEGCISKRTL